MARDTVRDVVRMLERAPDAKPFVFGAVSTSCVFDDDEQLDRDETGGEVRLGNRIATIARGVCPGLARNSAVTVDGDAYLVRELLRAENGDMLRVVLVPA